MQKTDKASLNKKELRKEVEYLLSGSLAHLKELLGEKKFNDKIEAAAKLLTKGLKKEAKNPKEVIKADKAATAKPKTTVQKIKNEAKIPTKTAPEVVSKPIKSAPKKIVKKTPADSE